MYPALPTHGHITHYAVRDDCLCIGGQKVTEIAATLGHTPFYVYDRAVVDRRIAQLRAVLPPEIELHYAVKANPYPELVRHIAPQVDGLDIASIGESHVALAAGMNPARVSFAGPGKRVEELRAAIIAGITLILESTHEMEVVARIGREQNMPPRVAVRVNPDFELKSAGMRMGGGPKPFGVDAEQVPDLLRQLGRLPLEFSGFHIFWGSQNLNLAAICEAQTKSVELALTLAAHASAPIRMLNIGGGLGIPYFPGESPLHHAPIGAHLAALRTRVHAALPEAVLMIELGRHLVGEAGVYVCRVLDRKISRGQIFLVTDGGLHHHLAASGNFGQIIRKNYPVVVANKVYAEPREVASVVGPLCTPLDLLADKMTLARAEVGDLIAVMQSGAYGYTASPLGFLSHPPPLELLV